MKWFPAGGAGFSETSGGGACGGVGSFLVIGLAGTRNDVQMYLVTRRKGNLLVAKCRTMGRKRKRTKGSVGGKA